MASAFNNDQFALLELSPQRLGGTGVNGAITASPDQQGRVIAYFRQHRFQFPQVHRPMPHDVEPVLECARNLQGSRIPLKCARWNAECVTVHALQPVGIGGTHAGQSEEEQRRPDAAAEEQR